MKKIILTALTVGLFGTAAFADSNVVSSANIVGYSQVGLAPGGKFYLVACNFSAGSNTLVDIFGTNQLAQSGSISACDKVVAWDSVSDSYQAYVQWTDGNFYKANSQAEFNTSPVVNPQINNGSGFWIISADTSLTTNDVYFSGDVIATSTQQVAVLTDFQIIAYPFSSDIELNETSFSDSGATKSASFSLCDKIAVWEGDHYQTYGLYSDGKWYKANNAIDWNTAPLATNVLSLSQGAWYIAITNFNWVETNKYMQIFQ